MTSNTQQFSIEVDGIGPFTFAKRTMRLEFRVQAEQSRLTEGQAEPSQQLATFAAIFSQLKVLTIDAPEGWDLDAMDPNDDDTWARLMKVHSALRAKELSFRRPAQPHRPGTGKEDGGNAGVLVPPAVPAGAN